MGDNWCGILVGPTLHWINSLMSDRPDHIRQAVLYARVSSEEQEKEGYSIPAQTKFLHEYAGNEGIKIIHEFIDVETAKQPGRPGFMEMVDFFAKEAKKDPTRRCRILLVEKTDRLYRNLKDYITIDDLGIDIHFAKEGIVLSPKSHSSEKFLHGIKVLMAKNYVDNLSEETRKGLQEKAEQGIWPLKASLGYGNVKRGDGKKVIEPDPETSPLVCQVFEWYATGNYALEQLAEMARDAGLRAQRSGKPLGRSGIHKLLCNRVYYGEFVWKGRIYKGVHEPIVTRELWDKVQGILRFRSTKKPRRVKHHFAFSNLITCAHCGCSLVGEIKKGRYVYYHCTGAKGACPKPYVREEILEQKFTELLQGLAFDQEVLDWVTEALRASHKDQQAFHEEAIERLQAEYNRLQKRLETMYVDKLDGRVDADFYETKSAEWRCEQARIRDAIEKHEHANQSYMEEGVAILELAQRAAELFEKQEPREKRRLLNFVLSNSTWDGETLEPEFRQPFDMIADRATACAREEAAGGSSDDLCQLMGGWGIAKRCPRNIGLWGTASLCPSHPPLCPGHPPS